MVNTCTPDVSTVKLHKALVGTRDVRNGTPAPAGSSRELANPSGLYASTSIGADRPSSNELEVLRQGAPTLVSATVELEVHRQGAAILEAETG